VTITGSKVKGNMHVRNDFYGPEGDVYSLATFDVGVSSYGITLGGHPPELYADHEVWFESTDASNVTSNHWYGRCPAYHD
jgi:hypothetical protein